MCEWADRWMEPAGGASGVTRKQRYSWCAMVRMPMLTASMQVLVVNNICTYVRLILLPSTLMWLGEKLVADWLTSGISSWSYRYHGDDNATSTVLMIRLLRLLLQVLRTTTAHSIFRWVGFVKVHCLCRMYSVCLVSLLIVRVR